MTGTNNTTATLYTNQSYSEQLGYHFRSNVTQPDEARVFVIANFFNQAHKQGRTQIDAMVSHALDVICNIGQVFFDNETMSRSQIVWHEKGFYDKIELTPFKKSLWLQPSAHHVYNFTSSSIVTSVDGRVSQLMAKLKPLFTGIQPGDIDLIAIQELLLKERVANVEQVISKLKKLFAEIKEGFDQKAGESPEEAQKRKNQLQEKVVTFFNEEVFNPIADVEKEMFVTNQVNLSFFRFINGITQAKQEDPVSLTFVMADYEQLAYEDKDECLESPLTQKLGKHKFVLLTPALFLSSTDNASGDDEPSRPAGSVPSTDNSDKKSA